MKLTKTELNSIPVYNLSSVGKALPNWVVNRKSRAGKARAKLRPADAEHEHVEVIQDLFFPTMSSRCKLTRDGETLMAVGGYPPQLRAFELRELSLKFERHFTSEVVDFQILSPDWKKAVYLLSDRSIEFHTQFGKHHTTRIPHHGRCLGYQPETTELLLAGAGPEVFRLSLERGSFLAPFDTRASAVNSMGVDPNHGMVVVGTGDGTIQCWDPRQRRMLGACCPFDAIDENDTLFAGDLSVLGINGSDRSVSAVRFDPRGLTLAAGTSTGHVALYDVRSSRPMAIKDHRYGLPIVNIKFHAGRCVSADSKIIKIWSHNEALDATGEPPTFTSIQPPADINGLCVFPDSGLVFASLEAERLGAYFIPALGPAPRWCHFVDSLTEEMESEKTPAVYEDYKFLSREEIDSLGLSALIGTKALRPYMHGFFIDAKLHAKAVSLSQPFAYEQWRKQRVQQRIEAKTAGRIAPVKKDKPPRVNAALAEEIAARERDAAKEARRKRKGEANTPAAASADALDGSGGGSLLDDSRFKALFTDTDFIIDKTSEEYLARRPHERGGNTQIKPEFTNASESEDENSVDSDMGEGDHSVGDVGSASDEGIYSDEAGASASARRRSSGNVSAMKGQGQLEPRMIGVRGDALNGSSGAVALPAGMTFAARLAHLPKESRSSTRIGGAQEMTFHVSSGADRNLLGDEDDFEEDDGWGGGQRHRGGVKTATTGRAKSGGKGGSNGGRKSGKGAPTRSFPSRADRSGDRRAMPGRHLTPQRGSGKGSKGRGGSFKKSGGRGRGGGRF